jgi:hypothetical protein
VLPTVEAVVAAVALHILHIAWPPVTPSLLPIICVYAGMGSASSFAAAAAAYKAMYVPRRCEKKSIARRLCDASFSSSSWRVWWTEMGLLKELDVDQSCEKEKIITFHCYFLCILYFCIPEYFLSNCLLCYLSRCMCGIQQGVALPQGSI